jgi:hypothetical protein
MLVVIGNGSMADLRIQVNRKGFIMAAEQKTREEVIEVVEKMVVSICQLINEKPFVDGSGKARRRWSLARGFYRKNDKKGTAVLIDTGALLEQKGIDIKAFQRAIEEAIDSGQIVISTQRGNAIGDATRQLEAIAMMDGCISVPEALPSKVRSGKSVKDRAAEFVSGELSELLKV